MPAKALPLHKLVVFGETTVGKSALVLRMCGRGFVETFDPTVSDVYRKRTVVDGQSCDLDIWDTAVSEECIAQYEALRRYGEGFLFVYSISSRRSFLQTKVYYENTCKTKADYATIPPDGYLRQPLQGTNSPNPVPRLPAVLVGNKCDLTEEREVSTEDGRKLAEQLGCAFIETSAKSGANVEAVLFDVVRQLRSQKENTQLLHDSTPRPNSASSTDSDLKFASHIAQERREVLQRTRCTIL